MNRDLNNCTAEQAPKIIRIVLAATFSVYKMLFRLVPGYHCRENSVLTRTLFGLPLLKRCTCI